MGMSADGGRGPTPSASPGVLPRQSTDDTRADWRWGSFVCRAMEERRPPAVSGGTEVVEASGFPGAWPARLTARANSDERGIMHSALG
jgi:hypothetical protein